MRVTFDKVSLKGKKVWRDKDGKRRQVTREFYQTVSPFNKNADGSYKTPAQIYSEIRAEHKAWMAQPGDAS